MTEGRIELTLRVGVTGHRNLRDEADAAASVARILDRLQAEFAPASVRLIAVSALAEGADRIVAREVLKKGGALEVSLPLHRERYLEDFATQASKDEFDGLLAQAKVVRAATPDDPTYRFAGVDIVDHCDVLVVIWDGVPKDNQGGTSAIVKYAASKPQVWIRTTEANGDENQRDVIRNPDHEWDGAEVTRLDLLGMTSEPWASIDKFNRELIDPSVFEDRLRARCETFGAAATAVGIDAANVIEWIAPAYTRASLLAAQNQDRLRTSVTLLHTFASLAVAVVAWQVLFAHDRPYLAVFEIASLLVAYVTYRHSHERRAHDRWLEYRFFAERLRTAYFVAIAGGDSTEAPDVGGTDLDEEESWVERATSDVWRDRPAVRVTEADSDAVKKLLVDGWIHSQRVWHEAKSKELRHEGEKRERIPPALFITTIPLALLHIFESGLEHFFDESLGVTYLYVGRTVALLSLVVPAVAAAFAAVTEQREYDRNAYRYARLASRLAKLETQMLAATSLGEVRALLEEMRSSMLDENNDWFGVMRFRDVKLG